MKELVEVVRTIVNMGMLEEYRVPLAMALHNYECAMGMKKKRLEYCPHCGVKNNGLVHQCVHGTWVVL